MFTDVDAEANDDERLDAYGGGNDNKFYNKYRNSLFIAG